MNEINKSPMSPLSIIADSIEVIIQHWFFKNNKVKEEIEKGVSLLRVGEIYIDNINSYFNHMNNMTNFEQHEEDFLKNLETQVNQFYKDLENGKFAYKGPISGEFMDIPSFDRLEELISNAEKEKAEIKEIERIQELKDLVFKQMYDLLVDETKFTTKEVSDIIVSAALLLDENER